MGRQRKKGKGKGREGAGRCQVGPACPTTSTTTTVPLFHQGKCNVCVYVYGHGMARLCKGQW